MDEQGRQRLLSALGPSLHMLWMKFPNSPPAVPIEHPRESGLIVQPSIHLTICSQDQVLNRKRHHLL